MNLQDWIDKYEEKTGEKFIRKKSFSLLFYPEKGFAEIGIDSNLGAIMVHRICGDLHAWLMVIRSIMQLCGYTKMTALVIRNMKPFIRLFGANITKSYQTEFGTAHEIEFSNGKGVCYPVADIGDKKQYLVALEVVNRYE